MVVAVEVAEAAVVEAAVEEAVEAEEEQAAEEPAAAEPAVEEPAVEEEVGFHHIHQNPSQDPSHAQIPIHVPTQNHALVLDALDPNHLLVWPQTPV